ncbi:MAG: hypothetical protein SAJ37_20690 [Oscillatoria sp. PMC 1068.18]|nr:hypothetical protein [Oscillatoria sp. PMC 1076.18]MEC4991159.1 hypothetical protein [Oscillatoria sp. PMC 1068.18]
MNILVRAIAATGLTATLIGSVFFNLNLRQELTSTKSQLTSSQSQRESLQTQFDASQQELDTSKEKITDLEAKLNNSQGRLVSSQGQVETLGVCLEGVVVMVEALSVGDESSAFVAYSNIAEECEQAGRILEEQRNLASSTMSL